MALPIDLIGRVAFVTGVTSGIGAGVARALAQAGCHVVGCGLEDRADRFVADVEGEGREAHYAHVDVTDDGALATFVEAAGERFGQIDVVVSNAGRNVFEGVEGCTPEAWGDCFDLDLRAHWRLARHAKPWLDRAARPVVLVVSSNHAFATIPGCFPYNVAKAGLVALVQSLAIEWGPHVRAVGVAPGFVDTPINDAWFATFDDPAAERRATEARHPTGRLGTPEEVGALCAFLASDHAASISGTTILADGGRSALMQDGPYYTLPPDRA